MRKLLPPVAGVLLAACDPFGAAPADFAQNAATPMPTMIETIGTPANDTNSQTATEAQRRQLADLDRSMQQRARLLSDKLAAIEVASADNARWQRWTLSLIAGIGVLLMLLFALILWKMRAPRRDRAHVPAKQQDNSELLRAISAIGDEVGALRDDVRALASDAARRRAAPPPPPQPRSDLQARPERSQAFDSPAPPLAPPPRPAALPVASESEVAGAFNALIRDTGSHPADFDRKYRPVTVNAAPNGYGSASGQLLRSEEGKFLAIDPGPGARAWYLLPSHKAVRDWQKLYVNLDGRNAKDSFGPFFDLDRGNGLEVIRPALVRLEGDGFVLLHKGRLLGLPAS